MKNIGQSLMKMLTLLIFLLYLTMSCTSNNNYQQEDKMRKDVHSFSRPQEAVTTHLSLDLTVDFSKQQISGKASLTIDNKSGTDKLYLDNRGLHVEKVTIGEDESDASFSLGEPVPYLGRPLIVDITPQTQLVHVYYSTNPNAAAVQWLTPEQTAGGKHPFLFTQSQAILARTWIPCQDSPGIRITYDAKITTHPELMAVMSAENGTEKNADGVYEFTMPQPIPSYLLALAVGDLEFRAIGKRSGVYAEPSVVEKAAWEFADTEKMIDAAEKLYGPYRWGRYDIIVLPPSFPFGGMENPRLTFATPTILAGDRSLVALIAHELAHSWSGNLVTNANWDDFWLNEGFTTYLEHRIMEEIYSAEYANMLAKLSFQDLQKEISDIEAVDTYLHLNLEGRDPDDGMTAVAYDKGHYFLRTCEKTFGREKWDSFLRTYFDEFAFHPMTSDKFVHYLRERLIEGDEKLQTALQIDAWVYGPGIPDNVVLAASDAFESVEAQAQVWLAGKPAQQLESSAWTTHEWVHFLRNLPASLSHNQMRELDSAFNLSKTGNSEILHAWLLHVIGNKYEPGYPALESFLTRQGRRKFLKPLYQKMAETPEGLEMARRIYQKARSTYHAISTNTIDEILNWQS
ncbi:MAG: M1 family metallopeptidase [bacterium]